MEIGIDIGSISIGAIILENGVVKKQYYLTHRGNITGTLAELVAQLPSQKMKLCITGKDVIIHQNIHYLDPIVAITDAACNLFPQVRHILYIGGESYTLIHIKDRRLQNYLSNSSCASGTGAFLEQQATRLGMGVEQFATCAAEFTGTPPRVATRCAVFAKTDIIHLQQQGVEVKAIAAGLCDSLVDGLVESLFKGQKLDGLTLITGGVALNGRVVQSIRQHVEQLEVSPYSAVMGAYGAALYAQQSQEILPAVLLEGQVYKEENTRPALELLSSSSYPDFDAYITQQSNDTEITIYEHPKNPRVYLGIDIGSTSTKAVLTSPEQKVLLGFYTRTAGRPIDAVKNIFRCILEYCQKHNVVFTFLGVGTTGSGRKLLKMALHADLEINEITAHARAAMHLYPEVDTIIEIGGQDAKFTRIANGSVTNAVMNYVCAAGTGSFIEEQAKRLSIPLFEFSKYALKGIAPITSERCTVYMERDINRLIRQGWKQEDIAAAVIYSVRDNYLNKVVAGAPVGDHIMFQGATARNRALVAAFEQYLQKSIKVVPYAHLTGALGVCITLQQEKIEKSSFMGLDFIQMPVTLETEVCTLCNNNCRLTVIETPNGKEAYGMMCGRDYHEQRYVAVKTNNVNFLECYSDKKTQRGIVVLPCALAMYEYLSLWKNFFQRLGFIVRVLKTDRKSFEEGKQVASAEFCAPLLSAQGLLWRAAQQNADLIFFPIFYKESNQDYGQPMSAEGTPCFFCYYTSHLPAIIHTRIPKEAQNKLITPLLQLDRPIEETVAELHNHLQPFGLQKDEIEWAYRKSQDEFLQWKQSNVQKGKQILDQSKSDDVKLVIMGRPYNTLDPVMNASLVEKIIRLGYPTIYYEMLEMPETEPEDRLLPKIHWNYGKKLYRAARMIAESDNLFPIYLTSFRCSPDAFIMTYFKYLMDHFKKPYLIIQLDEHCSDIGYLTRVEAAIDSFKTWKKTNEPQLPTFEMGTDEVSLNKTILIPHVDEIAGALVAAAFKSYGYQAIVLEESPNTVIKGFRYMLGGECIAIPAILGGIIKAVERYNLDPAQSVVFLPTSYIACNFPQFPVKISMALEKAGMPVKVINIDSFNFVQRLLWKMDLILWDAIIISDVLRRASCAIRPYEVNAGETDRKVDEILEAMEKATLEKRSKGPVWEESIKLLSQVKLQRHHRPRVLVTGDLYVKNNDAFNQDIVRQIEQLGGEVILTTQIEYMHYGLELARHKDPSLTQIAGYYVTKKMLENWEEFYNRAIRDLLPKIEEPSWDTMFDSLRQFGVDIELQGETAITIARSLCLARAGQIDAVVHINPSFCCAGNVSASLLEKIREDYNIRVLNIFYDGTDHPNSNLIPFMHYLCQKTQA